MVNKYQLLKLLIIYLLFSASILFSQEQRSLCFTFDDGNPQSILSYSAEEWNKMILDTLAANNLQAALFAEGKNIDNPDGRRLIGTWDKAGHIICNHTYSHKNYNSPITTFALYKNDILRCDSLISKYKNYGKFFRAPFLKYGDTIEKRDSLTGFLKCYGYKNGYVTIDCSDWYYNSRIIKFMKENPGKSIEAYKRAYIYHILDRARFYDDLAYKILGRRIKHSLLLHHNLTSALFLGDLIKAFKNDGWKVINFPEALKDDIYDKIPDILPAGESIVWALAKATGKFENILRYPGEDSIYEEDKLKKQSL